MAKQLNVSVAVTADTSAAKAQLQSLQTMLTELNSNSANLRIGVDTTKIKEASLEVTELQAHLKQATNINTGTLNFAKLDASIRSSGKTLQQYGDPLLKLGPSGQQAFSQLAQAVAQSEIPVKRLSGIFGEFGTVLKNTIRWQAASSIIHGMMGSIQHAYSYAQQLNESLNKIQIVTQASSEHMARFATQANKAAQKLSTTTTAYTDASLIYYQQGLNDQEVAKRTEVTIKMANASGQSAQAVSDQMTAIWNNFAHGSQSLEYYADVITALGAATASSSEEISKGLEKFASVADTVGLSYENATAALATITATTRQSADSVGTGLRTLFSRLQSVSLGETLDDGVTLTKYSKALNAIGVSILDQHGELRDMDAILEDMGSKWQTLSKAQQVAVAQTVGGVRQYTNLVALMDNWDFYKQNQQVALTSEGTVQAQADIYAQSWEASRKRVKAAAEGIYSELIDDQFFINFNDGFAKTLNIVNDLIQGLGGLKGVLSSIGLIASTLFKSEITAGIYNLGTNLKNMFVSDKTLQARRTEFLTNAANSAMGFKIDANGNVIGGTAEANAINQFRRDSFAEQLKLQNQYANQQKNMTPLERAIAEQQLGQLDTSRNNYEAALAKQRNAIIQSVDKRSSVISTGQRAAADLRSIPWKDRTDEQKAESQRFARNGWFDYSGKGTLSAKYYKELGQSLTEFKKPIEDFTKVDSRFQEFFKTGTQDIQAFKEALKVDGADETLLDQIDETMSSEDIQKVWSEYQADFKNIQEGQITDVAQQFGVNPDTLRNYINALNEEGAAAQSTKEYEAQLRQEREKSQKVLDNQNKQMKVAQTIQKVGTGLMGFASVTNAADGLVDTFDKIQNGAIDAGEGMTSMIGSMASLGMTAAMLIGQLGPVGAVIVALGIAFTALKKTGVIDDVLDQLNPERVELRNIKQAQAAEEIAKNIAATAKERQESFSEEVDTYNELIEKQKQLGSGTLEYALAVQEAGDALAELKEKYGDLLKDTDFAADGSLLQSSQDRIEQELAAQTAQAQSRATLARIGTIQAQNAHEQGELDRANAKQAAAEATAKAYGASEEEIGAARTANLEGQSGFEKWLLGDSWLAQGLRSLGYGQTLQAANNAMLGDALFGTNISGELRDMADEAMYVAPALQSVTENAEAAAEAASNISRNYDAQAQQYENVLLSGAAYNDIKGENGEAVTEAERFTAGFMSNEYLKAIQAGEDFYKSDFAQEFAKETGRDLRSEIDTYVDQQGNNKNIDLMGGQELIDAYRDLIGEFDRSLFEDENGQLDTNAIKTQLKAANEQKVAADLYDKAVAKMTASDTFKALDKFEDVNLQEVSQILSNAVHDNEFGQWYANQVQAKIDAAQEGISNILATEAEKDLSQTSAWFDTWYADHKDSLSYKDLINTQQLLYSLDKAFDSEKLNTLVGEKLFTEQGFDHAFSEALSTIDFSNDLSALFDLRRSSLVGPFRETFDGIYQTALEEMGGEQKVFSKIFGTEDFQKELKKVQKEFKKTGKVSTKNVEDIADSCDDLNEALDLNIMSAGAVADAIELYSMGAIDSIDSISEALWNALEAANELASVLQQGFDYVDNFNPDRSAKDIGDAYIKWSKEFHSQLEEGLTGDERTYQIAEFLGNKNVADNLRRHFFGTETGLADDPLGRYKQYQADYEAYDTMWQTVQKEGNMRAWWDYMLSGKGDQLYGAGINKEGNETTASAALASLGFSMGKNKDDVELDVAKGMTSRDYVEGIMKATGMSEDAAAAFFSELVGHSQGIKGQLQANEFMNGLNQLTDEKDIADYFKSQANNIDAGVLEDALTLLGYEQSEIGPIIDGLKSAQEDLAEQKAEWNKAFDRSAEKQEETPEQRQARIDKRNELINTMLEEKGLAENGNVDFSSPKFSAISRECKDLISKLLEKDRNNRIKCNECFDHPFFSDKPLENEPVEILDESVDRDTLESLLYVKKPKSKYHEIITAYMCLHFLDKDEEKKLNSLFRYIDRENKNSITEENIKEVFTINEIKFTQEDINNILNVFDYDQNNLIQNQEFLRVLCDKKKLYDLNNMKSTFEAIDSDKKNYITVEDFKNFITSDENLKNKIGEEAIEPFGMNPGDKMTLIHLNEVMTKNKLFSEISLFSFGKKKGGRKLK